ncbi:MAG: hypothetical protein NTX52_10310 [Planctomycetota bacterium]|nr:hypothetical protein [Planctomycetota bacterium]
MEKKWLLLGVVVVVCLCGVNALALDPMGAPAAGLKQGQFNGSLEYSYSDMDLKLTGGKYRSSYWYNYTEDDGDGTGSGSVAGKLRSTTLGAQMNKVYANLGYGIADNWEAFIRLGGADASFDYDYQFAQDLHWDGTDPNYLEKRHGDFSFAFAYGFGTKVTFWEQSPELKWGGLFQMSWASWDQTGKTKSYEHHPYLPAAGVYRLTDVDSSTGEISVNEIQIAVGPTWTPTQGVSIYGGPFLHFVYGHLEDKEKSTHTEYSDSSVYETWGSTDKSSYDISEDSCFGGYVGAQVELGKNVCVSAEWMTTGDAEAFGANAVWRF